MNKKDYFPEIILLLGTMYVIIALISLYLNFEINYLLWQAVPFLIAGILMSFQDKKNIENNDMK